MSDESGRAVKQHHYCTECRELALRPHDHREDAHDGNLSVDILPIVGVEDGQYVAKEQGAGHIGPHVWGEVGDHEGCYECGAMKVPEEVADAE